MDRELKNIICINIALSNIKSAINSLGDMIIREGDSDLYNSIQNISIDLRKIEMKLKNKLDDLNNR